MISNIRLVSQPNKFGFLWSDLKDLLFQRGKFYSLQHMTNLHIFIAHIFGMEFFDYINLKFIEILC